MTKKLDLQEVISRFKEVHGDKYDYSLVEYKNNYSPVDIICTKHGVFSQQPQYHANGSNCPKCASELTGYKCRLTLEDFIEKAISVHGNKYDYSETNYTVSSAKVKIICKEHGVFEQAANSHLAGIGCAKCSGKFPYNTETYIEKASKKHKNKYDYSLVKYTKGSDKIEIICKNHGVFKQLASCHLHGQGCPSCAGLIPYTFDTLSEAVIEKHSGTISLVAGQEIKGNRRKYEFVHSCGHSWFASADNVLQGTGCPRCAKRGFKVNEVGSLYIIQAGYITKVGITSGKVADRCSYISRKSGLDFKVIDNYNMSGHLCKDIEQIALKYLKSKYQRPEEYFHGYSECFYDVDVEELQSIIQQAIKDMT